MVPKVRCTMSSPKPYIKTSWAGTHLHRNVTKCTFGTRSMRQVILNNYVNKLRTYLFITQMVFYCILSSKREKCSYITTSAQRKHAFFGKIKEMSKTKKSPARKKIALELLHQRLGHRSTRSLLAGDNANGWEDI